MRTASLALLLALAPLQDEDLARWIRDLEDDAPELRDRAARALLSAGEEADEALRKAAEGGSAELRSRAASLLRERALRRDIDPFPRPVSLAADRRPAKEVLAELERQGRTPLVLAGIDAETLAKPVSVAVQKVPWFRALDAVCRAHGSLSWSQTWADGSGDETVLNLDEEAPPARPWTAEGAFAVGLSSISTSFRPAIGAEPARESSVFSFFWAQERGPRPLRATVEVAEILDELGGSWAERLLPPQEGWEDTEHVDRDADRTMPAVPPAPVARFARIRGDLVLEFPTAIEVLEFAKPAGAAGAERRRGANLLKLVEAKAREDSLEVTLEYRPGRLGGRTTVVLLDGEGKKIDGDAESVESAEGEDWERRSFVFPLEEGRIPALLRCTVLTGSRERRIPFDFRDVRFR